MRVVVVGAGVAGLEAVLALRKLAEALVRVDLVSPETEFVLRPLAVAEPFGTRQPRTFPLAGFAEDQNVSLHHARLLGVDPERGVAVAEEGELPYDALVLAIGAVPRETLPGALTFGGPADVEAIRGLVHGLDVGAVRSVAFVVPAGVEWTLPVYELALLTAGQLAERGRPQANLTIVTLAERPLEVFGPSASDLVERLLSERGIDWRSNAEARQFEDGRLELSTGEALAVDRVVALPRLEVPDFFGVPQTVAGFIPTDETGTVEGLDAVYAVGDVTTQPIKQGGLAAQQADAVAAAIARQAGAEVEEVTFKPRLRGILLGRGLPHYLLAGAEEVSSLASEHPLWWPGGASGKVAGRYLAPYLARWGQDPAEEPLRRPRGRRSSYRSGRPNGA